jgi:hypothetical protein
MLFPDRFSTESVKGQFERSLKTFNWLLAFESFTGGGGDPDLSGGGDSDDSDYTRDKKAEYQIRLNGARSKGLDIGGLTPKAIIDWYDNGWYDLFNYRCCIVLFSTNVSLIKIHSNNRFGTAPKVTRAVIRNSAAPISDDNESSSSEPPATPARRKLPASHVVSEPRHKSASFRATTASSMSAVGAYLEQKAVVDRERLEESKQKRAAEVKREKLDMAKAIIATPDADDELKAAAKQALLDFLRG